MQQFEHPFSQTLTLWRTPLLLVGLASLFLVFLNLLPVFPNWGIRVAYLLLGALLCVVTWWPWKRQQRMLMLVSRSLFGIWMLLTLILCFSIIKLPRLFLSNPFTRSIALAEIITASVFILTPLLFVSFALYLALQMSKKNPHQPENTE